MNHLDLLQTIAVLAMTLLGFVGVVATAGRLTHPDRKPIDGVLFYSMIAPSLTVLTCAFIPELASSLGPSPQVAWRVANGALGLLHLTNLLPVILQMRRVTYSPLQKSFMGSGVIMIAAHALAVSGLLPWAEFVFLLGLLQQLAVAIYMFLQLVQSERDDATA